MVGVDLIHVTGNSGFSHAVKVVYSNIFLQWSFSVNLLICQ